VVKVRATAQNRSFNREVVHLLAKYLLHLEWDQQRSQDEAGGE